MLRAYGGPDLTEAAINFNSTGENVVITAVAAKNILVYRIFFVVSAATTHTPLDGAGGTGFTGAMTATAGGTFVLDLDELPWFTTTRGNAFVISQTGTAQFSGRIYYSQR